MSERESHSTIGSVRAVERAVDILQALNRRPLSTVHQLHCETGLPKPSIIRLLRTLENKGLVAHAANYGAYQLLGRVKSLSSGFHHEPVVVEIADERMIQFTLREGWPLALALFDINAMVVRASTIPYTSLSLLHSSLNIRLSMVSRAMGRAFLANTSPTERDILIKILKESDHPEDRGAHDDAALGRMIEQVRNQGYATRDPAMDPKSNTIAIPIFDSNRVVATLGLTFMTVAMTPQQGLERYLGQLQALAERISTDLTLRTREETPPKRGLACAGSPTGHGAPARRAVNQ